MSRPPAPIHAVTVAGPPRLQDHRASVSCWCSPRMSFRDLATAAPVWVHRDEPERECPCSACRELRVGSESEALRKGRVGRQLALAVEVSRHQGAQVKEKH